MRVKGEAMSELESFYDRTSSRFWNPLDGLKGRDANIVPLINDRPGSFLEYGFGSGSLLFYVAEHYSFERVIGVDISETAIEQAAYNLSAVDAGWNRKVEFSLPEGDKLPQYADASMDVIVSVATIEHVLNPYVVLDELNRMAKDDALLICSVPNYAYIKHRIDLLFGKLPKTGTDAPVSMWRETGWDGMHLHTFTREAFDTLLRDCGWEPVSWTGWGMRAPFIKPLRQRFPQLLSGEVIACCQKSKVYVELI